MLRTIFYFIALLQISHGDFSFKSSIIELTEENASGECDLQYKHMDFLSQAKMKDSSSSLRPEGILEGNFVDLGVFDECLSIADESNKIYGKYCLASIRLDEIGNLHTSHEANYSFMMIQKLTKQLKYTMTSRLLYTDIPPFVSTLAKKVHLGICIPDKCTNEDLKNYLPLQIDDEKCYTKFTNAKMGTNAKITMSIIFGFFVIVICSTIYDVLHNSREIKPKQRILIAFSLYTNGSKLFKSSNNSDQLGCLHGIKALSMMWVILGHTYMNTILIDMIDNYFYLNDWLNDPKSMFILSATLSVDTFFAIGGILTVYVFMKSEEKKLKESFKMVPLLYLHRYIRLTPALAIMVLAYGSGLIKYLSDGPKWEILNSSLDACVESWWAALLYVQNYKDPSTMCVAQSWYLSVDFQLFIITPFLLIPLKRWPEVVIKLMSVLAVIGMIIPFCIGYTNKLTGIGLGIEDGAFGHKYYYLTHTRFSSYIIGMIFGYYIHKIKKWEKPLKFSIKSLLLLWTLLITGLLLCIFDGLKFVKDDGNEWLDGLYLGFNRSLWSLLIVFIILLCCTDNGGPINALLSYPAFHVISKLSYSMYLVHYIVILTVIASSRTATHFTNFVTLSQFFTFFILTLSISVLFSLIFESPMIMIEKIIFPPNNKKVTNIEEIKEKV